MTAGQWLFTGNESQTSEHTLSASTYSVQGTTFMLASLFNRSIFCAISVVEPLTRMA